MTSVFARRKIQQISLERIGPFIMDEANIPVISFVEIRLFTKCTDVGYCSSAIFGLGNTLFGRDDSEYSRCFSFMMIGGNHNVVVIENGGNK